MYQGKKTKPKDAQNEEMQRQIAFNWSYHGLDLSNNE